MKNSPSRTPRTPAKPRATIKLTWVMISLLVSITAAVPASYYAIPHVLRWRMAHGLVDPDLNIREKALNYLIRHAHEDPRLLALAVEKLHTPDQTNFLQITAALDHAGLWRRPTVPDDAWLRWINILARESAEDSRINASQLLTAAPDLATHEQAHVMLRTLANDDLPDVRYNALVTAASLLGPARNPQTVSGLAPEGGHEQSYLDIIVASAGDTDPIIARHAWIMVGLLNPSSGISANWQNKPLPIAEAIIWATLRTNPNQPAPAIHVLNDPTTPPALRSTAAYALHHCANQDAASALAGVINLAPDQVTEKNQSTIWRAILSANISAQPTREALDQLLASTTPEYRKYPLIQPLILSAAYRTAASTNDQVLPGTTTTKYDPLLTLAKLEGLTPNTSSTPDTSGIPDDYPPLLRLTYLAVTQNPSPDILRPLFSSPFAPMRDRAAVIAMDRFTPEQNAQLIESLLLDYNDDAKRSGAILAGLTGQQRELLKKKHQHEDIWSVKQVMALGLWMQSPNATDLQGRIHAPSMLTRDDLPTSTILLALLHNGELAALDYLLNPQGNQAPDLIELLDRQRWWPILQRYLPDTTIAGPPPQFWVWADPDLEEFQLELLREWYLLSRWELSRLPSTTRLQTPVPIHGSRPAPHRTPATTPVQPGQASPGLEMPDAPPADAASSAP